MELMAKRAQIKLAKDWLKVDEGYAALTALRQKAKDEANAKKRAKLVKDRDAMQKNLGDLEVKLGDRESEMYKLVPKAKKKT